MQRSYTAQHCEHSTTRGFDEVVRAFEAALGSVEAGELRHIVASAHSAADFEERVRAHEGSSGFMRFLTVDHGAWMSRYGSNTGSRMYTIGNPLIAKTMLKHSAAAGLNVPVRVLIYADEESGTTRLSYDLPSSLMSVLQSDEVTAAAKLLDAKLIALATEATGAEL